MAQASSIALITYRGDSPVFSFQLTDNSVAVDITGYVFEMTVDSRELPQDNSTELFTVAGVITDAANGRFTFQPTSANLSSPTIAAFEAGEEEKELYYDISLVNGTEKLTIIKSTLTVKLDIGKA